MDILVLIVILNDFSLLYYLNFNLWCAILLQVILYSVKGGENFSGGRMWGPRAGGRITQIHFRNTQQGMTSFRELNFLQKYTDLCYLTCQFWNPNHHRSYKMLKLENLFWKKIANIVKKSNGFKGLTTPLNDSNIIFAKVNALSILFTHHFSACCRQKFLLYYLKNSDSCEYQLKLFVELLLLF